MAKQVVTIRIRKKDVCRCQTCHRHAEAIFFISDYDFRLHDSCFLCLDCIEEYADMIYGDESIPKGFIFDGFLNN